MKYLKALAFSALIFCVPTLKAQSTTEREVFNLVEQMPTYPGGDSAMNKFIEDNMQYPQMEKENDIMGKIIVKFIVTEDGTLEDVKTLRGTSPGMVAEAERLVRSMPKWNPGKQGGKAVNVWYVIPVKFILSPIYIH